MRIVRTISELRAVLKALRESGSRIGFVPTMGFLHQGHGALIRQSAARCDATVVSIFVNPRQFNEPSDFTDYPRTEETDLAIARAAGADIPVRQVHHTTGCHSLFRER